MRGSVRRGRPPARKAIRHLVRQPKSGGGNRYYWQPPTKLRNLEGRPPWLRSTPLGDDPEKAVEQAERLNARLDNWRSPRGSRRTGMPAMIAAYLQHSRFTKLAPRTRKDYEGHLAAVGADFAGAEVADVTPVVLDRYREKLIREGSLGERQVLYRMQVLRLLFRWGKPTGWVKGDNPAAGLGLKTPKSRRRSVWKLETLRALAEGAYPVGLAVRLAVYTLQRQGDILAMRWDDIANDAVHVVQGKTDAEMYVPLHPRLAGALAAAPRRGATILATTGGAPYSGDGFRSLWARAVAPLPSPRPTFHDIRGTAASLLIAGGLADEFVMRFTGHKRQGGTGILDAYDARLGDVARRAFPVMDGWGV